jgi:hypothetical protein
LLAALARREKNRKSRAKSKSSSVLYRETNPRRELWELVNLAFFYHSTQRQPDLAGFQHRLIPGVEHQMISTIKTFRKQN